MTSTEREEMRVPGLPAPLSHYTDAVRFGNLLFVSGCAPIDGDNRLVGDGDLTAQTRKVLENLGAVLSHAGAGFADVLKVTVFMTDVSRRAEVNEVRKEFFGSAYPASTLIEVSALALPSMEVEIEAVVGLPG
ncbi:MAG: RidA family protein [Nocardioidaceae bacterium]